MIVLCNFRLSQQTAATHTEVIPHKFIHLFLVHNSSGSCSLFVLQHWDKSQASSSNWNILSKSQHTRSWLCNYNHGVFLLQVPVALKKEHETSLFSLLLSSVITIRKKITMF